MHRSALFKVYGIPGIAALLKDFIKSVPCALLVTRYFGRSAGTWQRKRRAARHSIRNLKILRRVYGVRQCEANAAMGCCCVVASCLLIIATSCVAELSRIVVNKAVRNDFSRLVFQEFIASAELCAVCYELIVVAETYGVWVYAVFLFALTLWWASRWDQASACPYIHLENFLEGSCSFNQAFLACSAEIAGGLAICKYVQYTWSLQLSDGHVAKSVWDCEADLHVDAISGAVIEGIATFVCRVVSRTIAKFEPRFGGALDAAVGTSLVVAAFDYSGGYFNPVLATSLKLNCHGHTNVEHFIVYWIGSTAGSVASWWLNANLHLFGLGGQQKKND